MRSKNRSSLLLRCNEEEAQLIRDAAKHEHRTISGYILNVVMSRIKNAEEHRAQLQEKLRHRPLH